ncbi:DJ-1/PfpI family protein [Shewanella sp. SM34]|uniref:DJ-1/PfpI family protein n=2 Tax=Shewanella TaxID=22 RepID=UPI0021D9B3BB|nr:DJ-1/PfpI family protein [Shewanella sp. SM35]MCU8066772.1 DJ-1/PfpI family protein [Shewanella sp. SM34]
MMSENIEAAQSDQTNNPIKHKLRVGIFLYPGMTMLDAYGPLQFLAFVPSFETFTFAKTSTLLPCDAGVNLQPNYDFDNCPPIDILLVPGSANPLTQIQDEKVISFLKRKGEQAQYITSVCTGALILAATGLLNGYRTTTHWAYASVLAQYPQITFENKRIVIDRNRISGGGITAGLDFALALIANIEGEQQAKTLQLLFEYDPKPPFNCGSPLLADASLVQRVEQEVRQIASGLF